MKKLYKEKIKLYSALAGGIALAGSNDSEAQVVYTDINPDTVVNATHTSYDIDLNKDGISDFTIKRQSNPNYTYFTIKGSSYYNSSQRGTVTTWSVDTLNLNDTIKSSNNFSSGIKAFVYFNNSNPSNGGGVWLGGATDKYVGVKFQVSGVDYYGWIRVDLASDFSVMTIKDFAYESSPGALIKAGAMSSVPAVSMVNAADAADAGDASDIYVQFQNASDETNITNYRVFVAPATSGFNLDTAQMTVAGNYFDIAKTGNNISSALPASLKDVYGNAITNGVSYKVFVMSIGADGYDDALSAASNNVTLGTSVPVVSNIVASDNGNAGDASDMMITFDKASDETNISSYAVLIVPTSMASNANINNAESSVLAGNYTNVTPTGSNISLTLSPTAKDVAGNPIVTNVSYEVFVLSIATGNGNSDALSNASGSVTLSGVTGINSSLKVASGISAYENKLFLKDMPGEGKMTLHSIQGAQVFSGLVSNGDNVYQLINVPNGIYVVKVVLSDNEIASKKVYISGN